MKEKRKTISTTPAARQHKLAAEPTCMPQKAVQPLQLAAFKH